MKWGLTLAVALTLSSDSPAQDHSAVVDGIAARRRLLDNLYTEFVFEVRRAAIHQDPFERQNWTIPDWEGTGEASFHFWLCRPDFKYEARGGTKGGMAGTAEHSWQGGRLTSKVRRDADGPWSVIISPNCWPCHMHYPFLTPLELHFFEVEESWMDLVAHGELIPQTPASGLVVLVGGPLARDPPIPAWRLRVTVDPARAYLPLEMSANLDIPSEGVIEWKFKTLSARPVAETWAIEEAVLVLKPVAPSVKDYWAIYHFVAGVAEKDKAISADQLAIAIPDRNVNLLDRTTGLTRHVDSDGTVLLERTQSREELQRAQRERQRSMMDAVAAQQLLAHRQRAFQFVVLGAAGLTGVAWAIVAWRRKYSRVA